VRDAVERLGVTIGSHFEACLSRVTQERLKLVNPHVDARFAELLYDVIGCGILARAARVPSHAGEPLQVSLQSILFYSCLKFHLDSHARSVSECPPRTGE